MAPDPSAAVRREVALTMRDVPLEQSRDILVEIAKWFDGKDRTYLEAFGTGCEGKEREIYQTVAKFSGGPAEFWSDAFAGIAWRLHPEEAVAGLEARALSSRLSQNERKRMMDAIAFVDSPIAAEAMMKIATSNFPYPENAMWWLNNRRSGNWKPFGLTKAMRQRGLLKETPLVSVITPELPEGAPKAPTLEEVLALKGDAARGEAAVAACYVCHKIGKQGTDFGPDLTQFGKTQPREVLVNGILNPSKDISHGFEGSRIELKDGLIIDGIILAQGDPTVVKCLGGQRQEIDEDRIKSVTKLERSLMFPPQTLGLTAQTIADMVAYLQSNLIK